MRYKMTEEDYAKAKSMIKVNDILVSTWGYSCTMIDFYKVLKITEKSLTLVKLKPSRTYNPDQSNYTKPTSEYQGMPFSVRIKGDISRYSNEKTYYSSITSYSCVLYTNKYDYKKTYLETTD